MVDRLIFQTIAENSYGGMERFFENILSVDDAYEYGGDGNVYNGTPHYKEIYETFVINHGITGLQIIPGHPYTYYNDVSGDYDGIIEGPDGEISLKVTILHDYHTMPLADIRVIDEESTVSSSGYTFESIEAQGSYGSMYPGCMRDVTYILRPRDRYILPHDETFKLQLKIEVELIGGPPVTFDVPLEREIRVRVGGKNEPVGTPYISDGRYTSQTFAFQDNKIVFAALFYNDYYDRYTSYIFLYNIDDGTTSTVRSLAGEDQLIDMPAGRIGIDGRNIVWAERLDRYNPWVIYLYDLGQDQTFGTPDDGGVKEVTSIADGGINPTVHGSLIAYIRNNEELGLYDMGPDMVFDTPDDIGFRTLPETGQGPHNVNVHDGYVVWSDAESDQAHTVYLYSLATGQLETLGYGQFPDVDAEWIVWEKPESTRIMAYNLGIDGDFDTPDDIGYIPLTSSGICSQPRLSGNNLLYINEDKMRLEYTDLDTLKHMAVSDVAYPRFSYHRAALDGNRVAYVKPEGYGNIYVEEITYGDDKIATDLIPLWSWTEDPYYTITESTVWSSVDRPYLILDPVVVSGTTLTIDPGVQVRFLTREEGSEHRTALAITGTSSGLFANGQPDNRIEFTRHFNEEAPDWDYPIDGLWLQTDYTGTFEVSHATFLDMIYGLGLNGNYSGNEGNVSIQNNIIHRCNYGLSWYGQGEAGSNTSIINNTIVNNNYGVLFSVEEIESGMSLRNNIITQNHTGIKAFDSVVFGGTLEYNNVWDNGEDYVNVGIGENDIAADPLFVASEQGNFILGLESPSLDAGDPDNPYDNEPEPNGCRINQGAYGNTSLATTSVGCGGHGNCFLAGTPITLADGSTKPIEQITLGDTVLAFNQETGELKPDKVSHVFSDLKADSYLVINDSIKVTEHHPVLSNGKWVKIGRLKQGDILTDINGKDIPIKNIEVVNEPVNVYNFETNPYHTYVAAGIIVHNKKVYDTVDVARGQHMD